MRLNAPLKAPDFVVKDIHGVPVRLADYRGRRLMISFFRDARCPFCNLRIYQLTHHYTDWRARNLEILTFFSSDAEAIRSHLARHPRPFTMIGDPELAVYEQYRVEHSRFAAMKAMFLRMHRMLLGLRHGGAMTLGKHKTIVPADFLVDEHGLIREVWYGRDIGDHIPLSVIEEFVAHPPAVSAVRA